MRPRVVVVTRMTPLELLLIQHGTLEQARFYLKTRGEDSAWHEQVHAQQERALAEVQAAIPPDQRRVRVDREQLDRFLFAPDDIIVVVGQDGLVPNIAKYLSGQLAIGINPNPKNYDGVLCRHPAKATRRLLGWLEHQDGSGFTIQRRTMAEAKREDGQRMLALNEIFIGHRSHQSARYRIRAADLGEERQSSSGLIVATGTGSTGWALSITLQRGIATLPTPEEGRLTWLVREPFPSVSTGTKLDYGEVTDSKNLWLVSEMGEGGVAFADGIETDRVEFLSGESLEIGIAEQRLNLVVPVPSQGR